MASKEPRRIWVDYKQVARGGLVRLDSQKALKTRGDAKLGERVLLTDGQTEVFAKVEEFDGRMVARMEGHTKRSIPGAA